MAAKPWRSSCPDCASTTLELQTDFSANGLHYRQIKRRANSTLRAVWRGHKPRIPDDTSMSQSKSGSQDGRTPPTLGGLWRARPRSCAQETPAALCLASPCKRTRRGRRVRPVVALRSVPCYPTTGVRRMQDSPRDLLRRLRPSIPAGLPG